MVPNSSMKKLALGCAALAAALLAYRWFTETPAAPWDSSADSALAVDAGAPRRAGASRHVLEVDVKTAERAPGSVAPPPAESAAHALVETLFRGRLLDSAGHPLAGSSSPIVTLTDAEGRRRSSGEHEEAAFVFSALPYGKYWVSASAEGYIKATDEIELDAAHAQFVKDYTLAPAPILKIRVVTPAGANLFDEELQFEGRPALAAIATRELPGKWIDEVVGSLGNPYGIGRFFQSGPRVDSLPGGYMGILMLDEELPAFVSLVNFQRVLQTQAVKPGDDVVTFVITPEELAASLATTHMQVVDPVTLAPLGGSRTVLWGGGFVDRAPELDPTTRVVFVGREPAPFDLHSGAEGSDPSRSRTVANSVAADHDRSALEQELDIEIKVVDSNGAPRNAAFTLGTYDPLNGTLRLDQQSSYVSTGDGELEVLGLSRRLYVLRTAGEIFSGPSVPDSAAWVSGNVILDLRPRSAPSSFVITLTRATRVMVFARTLQPDGLSFRVIDEQGLELESGRFSGNSPRPLLLPQGGYRFALLDESGQELSEQPVTVGTRPLTVVLAR
jgi:hypothetical protein